jgi:hypothetical protein
MRKLLGEYQRHFDHYKRIRKEVKAAKRISRDLECPESKLYWTSEALKRATVEMGEECQEASKRHEETKATPWKRRRVSFDKMLKSIREIQDEAAKIRRAIEESKRDVRRF